MLSIIRNMVVGRILFMLSQVEPFSAEDTKTYPLSQGLMQVPLINSLSGAQDVQLLLVAKQLVHGSEQSRQTDLPIKLFESFLSDDKNVLFGQFSRQSPSKVKG